MLEGPALCGGRDFEVLGFLNLCFISVAFYVVLESEDFDCFGI